MSDLDWDDLRFLARVLEIGTLAGSARAMGVEHSTVGRRLSALERSLGAPLVLRSPDGLRPTALGRKAMPLVAELERLVGELRQLANTEQNNVRLATPSGFTSLFSASITELADLCPGVSLEIISSARPVDLLKGEADLAIRSGPVADGDLIGRKLCDAGFSLYAAPAYLERRPEPIDTRTLTGHEVIGFDPAFSHMPPARWIADNARAATIVLRTREMSDVLSAAQAGVGIAVLPCLLASDASGLVRVTNEVVVSHRLWLVHRHESRIAKSIELVKRWIVEIVGRHKKRISGQI